MTHKKGAGPASSRLHRESSACMEQGSACGSRGVAARGGLGETRRDPRPERRPAPGPRSVGRRGWRRDTYPVFPAAPSQPGPSSSRVCFLRGFWKIRFDEQQSSGPVCAASRGSCKGKFTRTARSRSHGGGTPAPSHVQPRISRRTEPCCFRCCPGRGSPGVSPPLL